MATGTYSDFTIYHEEFWAGVTEVLMQQSDGFGPASQNTINIVPLMRKGDYEKSTFFKEITALVARRDVTSVSTATDTAMTQGENVAVKLNRKIGPVANTLDSLRKITSDSSEMSLLLGQQIGQAVALDYLNSGIRGAVAAIRGVSGLVYDAQDAGGTVTMTHTHLVNGMAKMGDGAQNIRAWVMHSKSYFDLVKQAISDNIYNVAGLTIARGTVETFNRPVIITDSAALKETSGSSQTTYFTLGLVENAVILQESEGQEIVSEIITGYENLLFRIQGEYAFNVKLKGFAWDTTNGGVNPADTAVATSTNWDQVATDTRACAGVMIVHE